MQTECMINISKLLADIRDVGHMNNVALGVMTDSVIDKVSDGAIRHADKELKKLHEAMVERWSE